MSSNRCGIIILAGGLGRIGEEYKTLRKIGGLSMTQRLITTMHQLCWPMVVVTSGVAAVQERLQFDLQGVSGLQLVLQPWRLGTADAFARAAVVLNASGIKDVLVVHADMPCWSIDTVQDLVREHFTSRAVMTAAVVRPGFLPNPAPICFQNFGRIMHDNDHIQKIVEPRARDDSSGNEHYVLNAALYCLNCRWALDNLWNLKPKRKYPEDLVPEFFLPELLLIGKAQDERVHFVPVPWWEAFTANTEEELQELVERPGWR